MRNNSKSPESTVEPFWMLSKFVRQEIKAKSKTKTLDPHFLQLVLMNFSKHSLTDPFNQLLSTTDTSVTENNIRRKWPFLTHFWPNFISNRHAVWRKYIWRSSCYASLQSFGSYRYQSRQEIPIEFLNKRFTDDGYRRTGRKSVHPCVEDIQSSHEVSHCDLHLHLAWVEPFNKYFWVLLQQWTQTKCLVQQHYNNDWCPYYLGQLGNFPRTLTTSIYANFKSEIFLTRPLFSLY